MQSRRRQVAKKGRTWSEFLVGAGQRIRRSPTWKMPRVTKQVGFFFFFLSLTMVACFRSLLLSLKRYKESKKEEGGVKMRILIIPHHLQPPIPKLPLHQQYRSRQFWPKLEKKPRAIIERKKPIVFGPSPFFVLFLFCFSLFDLWRTRRGGVIRSKERDEEERTGVGSGWVPAAAHRRRWGRAQPVPGGAGGAAPPCRPGVAGENC